MQRLVASLLVVVGAVADATADPDPITQAKKLWDEGRTLAKQGDYVAACNKFEKSFQLDPGLGTELNLADCYEHRAQTAKAWHLFDAVAREAKKQNDASKLGYARDRADNLVKQLVTVVVRVPDPAPDDLEVAINGVPAPAPAGDEIRDYADPGTIEVDIRGGGKAVHRQIRGAAGAEVPVDLAVHASETPASPERSRGWVRAAYVVGGTGAVGLVVASVLAIEAKSKNSDALQNHCMNDPSKCDGPGVSELDSAGSLADGATIATIAGAALLATGVGLYLLAPREAEHVAISPIATAHEIGVAIGGRF